MVHIKKVCAESEDGLCELPFHKDRDFSLECYGL